MQPWPAPPACTAKQGRKIRLCAGCAARTRKNEPGYHVCMVARLIIIVATASPTERQPPRPSGARTPQWSTGPTATPGVGSHNRPGFVITPALSLIQLRRNDGIFTRLRHTDRRSPSVPPARRRAKPLTESRFVTATALPRSPERTRTMTSLGGKPVLYLNMRYTYALASYTLEGGVRNRIGM